MRPLTFVLLTLILLVAPPFTTLTGGSTASAAQPACPATTPSENEALAHRWFDEAWNRGNVNALDDLLSPDHIHHWAYGADTTGATAVKDRIQAWRTTLPDFHATVEQLIATADTVVARWTATGTHLGPFQELAPTGRAAEWTGINIFRIACGRIVEIWSEMDTLGFLQQLGALSGQGMP
jgi:steroid delta-isomerase-like uncharacterized protein